MKKMIVVVALGLAWTPARAAKTSRFDVARLEVDGEVTAVVPADLDGDGHLDLIAATRTGVPPRQKRFFAVFWNQGRRFSPRPDLVLPVDDAEVCAFDVADTDGDKSAELLTIGPKGVGARSLRGRRAGPVAILVSTPTLFLQPAPGELPRIAVAHRLGAAAGPPELLVPGPGALEVYRRSGGAYARTARMEVALDSRARNPGGGRAARDSANASALIVTTTFPALTLADTDGDGRKDIVAANANRMAIYRQGPELTFPGKPSVSRDFSVRSVAELTEMSGLAAITVTDIDADGVADVVVRKQVMRGIASATCTNFVYFGRRGGRYADKPDQVIRSEGVGGTEIELFDVTGDGRTDMIVPSVNIGVMAIVRMLTTKTVKVSFQVFPYDPQKRRFADRPAAERQLKFKISLSGEAGVQAVDMHGDYNGDRRPDLAFATDDDELSIFPGLGGGSLFEDDALEEIALPAFGTLESVDLDGQGKSDMVLRYANPKKLRNQLAVLLNRGPW